MKVEIGALSKQTAKAGAWLLAARFASKGADFATLVILARFLGPGDFGLVAMAMTVILIVEAVMELPLSVAMLRVPDPNPDVYNTAFTLGLLRGVIIAGFFVISAWPLSLFYGEERLAPLMMCLALAPAMRGCVSPKMVDYNRRMDFRRQAGLDVVSKLIAIVAAITMAILTHSYWAIAVGTILVPVVLVVGSYILAPMRPRFTLKEWPVFANILTWNLISQMLTALNWQMDRLVLPRFIAPAPFGRYAMANDLSGLPNQMLAAPLAAPLDAAFVAASQRGGLDRTYLKASVGYFLMMAPILCFGGIMAAPLVHTFLGAQWAETAPLLTGLALGTIASIPAMPMAPLAISLNQSRNITLRSLIECAVRIPLTIIAVLAAGVVGVVIAKAIATLAVLISTMMVVRSMTGLSLRAQTKALAAPIAALLISGIPLAYIAAHMPADGDVVMNLLRLAAAGILYTLIYSVAACMILTRFGDTCGIGALLAAVASRVLVRLKV